MPPRRLTRLVLALLGSAAPAASQAPSRPEPGFSRESVLWRGARYEVVWADPARVDVTVHWRDGAGRPFGSLRALEREMGRRGVRLLAATNAGIYERAPGGGYRPLGLHVERGRTLRPLNLETRRRGQAGWGNFYLLPNAVFLVDARGRARILDARQAAEPSRLAAEATQSGPALVLGGRIHPAFAGPGRSVTTRNAVGVCRGGRVAIAATRDRVSVHDLALLFRDRLECPDALYLDGTVSGLLVPSHGVRWEDGTYAGILAVTART